MSRLIELVQSLLQILKVEDRLIIHRHNGGSHKLVLHALCLAGKHIPTEGSLKQRCILGQSANVIPNGPPSGEGKSDGTAAIPIPGHARTEHNICCGNSCIFVSTGVIVGNVYIAKE